MFHEKYQHTSPMSYDIALIEINGRIHFGKSFYETNTTYAIYQLLNFKIIFRDEHNMCVFLTGDFIKPVCLPHPGERFPPKTMCVVGGWGRITESEK